MVSKSNPEEAGSLAYKLFASCHGLIEVENEILGDQLDIRIFEFSGFQMSREESREGVKFRVTHGSGAQIEILDVNDFESDLQRMSCIVRDVSENRFLGFVKGSPEKIREICLPQTLPRDFDKVLESYTMKGLRVLGIAYKDLESGEDLRGRRDAVECELRFLGLLVMENQLKPDTAECIRRLQEEGGIECKVISGDNPLTTIQTSIECKILSEESRVVLVDVIEVGQDYEIRLQRVSQREGEDEDDEEITDLDREGRDLVKLLEDPRVKLCITGKAYDILKDSKRVELTAEQFGRVLNKTKVFSRMRPEQKKIIIQDLQSLDHKVG